MQITLLLTALAALAIAHPSDSAAAPKCVTGAHIIVARGSNLPQSSLGTLAEVVQMIKAQVPNSDNVSTVYPASVTNPNYITSINMGVNNTRSQIATYVAKCGADRKIVLLGFSQGGTVMTNTLVGAYKGATALASQYFNNSKSSWLFFSKSYLTQHCSCRCCRVWRSIFRPRSAIRCWQRHTLWQRSP